MTERRRGLGKGLGALIPTGPPAPPAPAERTAADPVAEAARTAAARTRAPLDRHIFGGGPADERPQNVAAPDETELAPVVGAQFAEIPLAAITPNPKQPRQVFEEDALAELVHSLREVGVLQPIVVRPAEPGSDGDAQGPAYELVMGERRWRAAQLAGLDVIPAIVRATGDNVMLLDALLENLHRAALNPLEEAAAYDQLLTEFSCTHDELAARIGRSRSQVTNTVRLLKLPPTVQRKVAAGVLSAGHARALLAVADPADAEYLAHRIVAENLSVRAVEELVAVGETARPTDRTPRAPRPATPELDDLAASLADRWDTRVKVQLGRSRGKLVVEFASVEDLERIVALMSEPGGPSAGG